MADSEGSLPRTVLHLIETSGIGGAERVLVDISRNVDRDLWRAVVVVPWSGWLLDRLTEAGVEAIEVRQRGPLDLAYLWRVAGIARRVKADILHSHLFGSAVRAGILSPALRIPAVATIHGEDDFRPTERWSSVKLPIIRRGVRDIVFVSEPLRRSCLQLMRLPEEMTSVINNGVDASEFSPGKTSSLRSQLGIRPNAFVVGCVGRLQPIKGVETFLAAAALLRASSPDYHFVIIGSGTDAYTGQLVALRNSLGLADDVVFTGARDDVSDAMTAFDVYALTSRSEGFSLSTIEAMASGRPVVATRCGGPEQILHDGATGLLVENGSAEAVAGAIERLRRNPTERARIGRAAREAVLRRYTVDAQVRAYQDLYDRALMPRHQARQEPRASYAG
jgi:glycosyltransferase involved in cell wall biosynthesis